MTHHNEEENPRRRTPSQAEGGDPNGEDHPGTEQTDDSGPNPAVGTPSQAEGSREVINAELEEGND